MQNRGGKMILVLVITSVVTISVALVSMELALAANQCRLLATAKAIRERDV